MLRLLVLKVGLVLEFNCLRNFALVLEFICCVLRLLHLPALKIGLALEFNCCVMNCLELVCVCVCSWGQVLGS